MRFKRIIKFTFFLLLAIGIFYSCQKKPASWDVNLLAPIVNASMSINDLLTTNYLKANPDSSVSLVYTDSLYNLSLDTLLPTLDTTLKYDTVNYFIAYTFKPGDPMFPSTKTSTLYTLGSVELVKGIIRSGYLNFSVRNHFAQPIDYIYKVWNVIKDTLSIKDTLEIFVRVPSYSSVTKHIPLAGYTIDFTGIPHNLYNTIITSIYINLDSAASNPLTVNVGDSVLSASVSFTGVVPYFVKGYFGTTTKSFGPDSVVSPIFNKIVSGQLNLQDANVTLTLKNGFGLDARLFLNELSSYNSRTHTYINLTDNEVINHAINVNRATQTYNPASPVTPSVMTFSITPSNSNILAWLDNLPTSVGYKLSVETDPLGNVSGSNDFAFYGYGINSYINITIPLNLIANNLCLVDTLGINLAGSVSTTQHIKNATLTLYASNGFPFSAGLQMYMLDKYSKAVTDSLFIPSQTIAAGNMNDTGLVTSPKSSILVIDLDTAHTRKLLNTQTVKVFAKFNMGNLPSGYRKIYDYYRLSLKLVGRFDYEIN